MLKLNNERHIAEDLHAKTLLRHPDALELADNFIQGKENFADIWPDWCYFPMSVTSAVLTSGMDASSAAKTLSQRSSFEELSLLTAAICWNPYKGVYRFDASVADALRAQPLVDKVPAVALWRLPEPCVFIESKMRFLGHKYTGFFAWLEYDLREHTSKGLELCMLFLDARQNVISFPVVLHGSIDESVDELAGLLSCHRPQSLLYNQSWVKAALHRDIAAAINLVLYMCTNTPDISGERSWHNRVYDERKPVETAMIWDVGVSIGNAIRRYEDECTREDRKAAATESGTSCERPAPHSGFRYLHWYHHSHWPSDDDRPMTLRWLPPIPFPMDTWTRPR